MSGSKPGERRGGRQKGTPNRRTSEAVAELMGSGQTPLEYLVGLYRDEKADPKERAWAANAVAPFIHPRLAPTQQTVTIALPDTSTAQGVKEAIAAVIEAVSYGDISPAEGQSLVSVIESQRKAIETTDIIERLEKLEAAQTR